MAVKIICDSCGYVEYYEDNRMPSGDDWQRCPKCNSTRRIG